MVLPIDVTYGVTPGHLAAHNALHGRRNSDGLTPTLPTAVAAGESGHDTHHAALKTWHDSVNPGNPAPAYVGAPSHELAHEQLAAWDNGRTTGVSTWLSGASGDGSGSGAFGAWRGRPSTVATCWAENATSFGLIASGEYGAWTQSLCVNVGAKTAGESWSQAAAGGLDARWVTQLQALRSAWEVRARGTLFIAFAHECNGNWMEWSVTTGDTANFVAAVKRYRGLQKQYFPAAKFGVSFNRESNGYNGDWRNLVPRADAGQPANQYQDFGATSWYNQWPPTRTAAEWPAISTEIDSYGAPEGIAAKLVFYGSIGLPMGVPEWAGKATEGDYPDYITAMYDLFAANAGNTAGRLWFETYFNVSSVEAANYAILPSLEATRIPLSAAAYRQKWSGTIPTVPPPTSTGLPKTIEEGVPAAAGTWEQGSIEKYSQTAASTLTFTFTGDRFNLYCIRDAHHGIMGVQTDTGPVVNADQYASVREEGVLFFSSPALTNGPHTIVLSVTGTQNTASSGTVVTFDKAIAFVTDGSHDGTTVPPPVVTPPPPGTVPPTSAFITRSGNQILRNGVPWWFVGYNSFVWSGNCGSSSEMMSRTQVDDWLDNHVRHDGHGLLRIYFWPGWDRDDLRHIVAAAKRNSVYLMITLQEWHTYCGQQGWDAGRLNSSGGRADYTNHANPLLDEFKNEPTIAAWEWFNEPGEPNELRSFFDALGPQFRTRDPNHLWSSGAVAPYWMGDNEGSMDNPNWRLVHESTNVDIVSVHEYDDNEILSNHYDNAAANGAGKPVLVGEMGMGASANTACKESLSKSSWSYATRAQRVKDKMNAYIREPAGAGVCYWAWQPGHGSDCSMSTGTNDPALIAAIKAVTK